VAKRGPRLPVASQTPTAGSNEEAEAIRILCSRSRFFCWFTNVIPAVAGRVLGYHGEFQKFSDWSNTFSDILLAAQHQEQRRDFLRLRNRRNRSGAVLFSLYLFAQEYLTEEFSDDHFGDEAAAAKKLGELVAVFEQDARPHLATLDKAPGLWPHDAESISSSIQQMKDTAREPGTKLDRNSFHRDLSHTLLRLSVYMCGHLDTSRAIKTGISYRLGRRMIATLLGPNPDIDGTSARGIAQVAAWAAGKWISLESLKRLYYEERNPASEAIDRHVEYHLGWKWLRWRRLRRMWRRNRK
jgi:hypothetical protein